MSNILNKVFNVVRLKSVLFKSKIISSLTITQLKMTNVKIGAGCVFVGFAHFQRSSSSTLEIGKKCTFRSSPTSNLIGVDRPCIISVHDNATLKIGDNCGLSGTVIGCFSKVILEDHVRCGANTLITDSDWHLDDPRTSPPRPIHLKKNVWLGVNVTVMKGVTIGENSVIGAGSVVTKDIPANVIAAGNPCKVIKSI